MNLCRMAIVWLFVILMSNVVFAAGKPLVETTKTDVDDQYYLDTVENDRIYILTAAMSSSRSHGAIANIKSLTLGLQKLATTYRIVNVIPLQASDSASNPTRALMVFVESKPSTR